MALRKYVDLALPPFCLALAGAAMQASHFEKPPVCLAYLLVY